MLQQAQSGPSFQKIEADYQAAGQRKDQKAMSVLQEKYMDALKRAQDSVILVLEKKPLSLGLINILEGNMFDKDEQFDFYQRTANRISAEWPTSRYGQQ